MMNAHSDPDPEEEEVNEDDGFENEELGACDWDGPENCESCQ